MVAVKRRYVDIFVFRLKDLCFDYYDREKIWEVIEL